MVANRQAVRRQLPPLVDRAAGPETYLTFIMIDGRDVGTNPALRRVRRAKALWEP